MYFKYLITIIYLSVAGRLLAQESISGRVKDSDGALIGANVYWQGTSVGTFTNGEGYFELEKTAKSDSLVVSYAGFSTKILGRAEWNKPTLIIELAANKKLKEVTVEEKVEKKEILTMSAIQSEKITARELGKAACCNLSESFETNPSVDVNFADAITGSRRIKMLGLDGVYSLITLENMPEIRGLSSAYGLSAVPGPWIESIQLAKGIGSVINGYEAITGQINIEEYKGHTAPSLHYNAYVNSVGRIESSVNKALRVNPKWSTMVMAHGNFFNNKVDANGDGFMDLPLIQQAILNNRWKYIGNKIEAQVGGSYTRERRQGGMLGHDVDKALNESNPWGMVIDQEKLHAFAKVGLLPPADDENKSIGFINSFSYYRQSGYYGLKEYTGVQNYWHSNLIAQDNIFNQWHMLKGGITFNYDDYQEDFNDLLNNESNSPERTEIVIGPFLEYTYHPNERFSLVAGNRLDYHNMFGVIYTPRLHLRYKLNRETTWRMAAGSGQRTPNFYTEQSRGFVSSRRIRLPENLEQERAWNTGMSLVWQKEIKGRDASITLDAYHTEFTNQVIMNMDANRSEFILENLTGRSFATVLQGELNYEFVKRVETRISYKWQSIQANIGGGDLRYVPFAARNKFLANIGYETPNGHWLFDATLLRTTPGRLPDNVDEVNFQDPEPFWRLNAQVTYDHGAWELYLGGENITDYTQNNPIINAESPFSERFDAANTWAPIFGRMIYLGFRLTIF